MLSLPTRGEWIEISVQGWGNYDYLRLSPHGESGLKSILSSLAEVCLLSLPTRGEWIEIYGIDTAREV